MFFLQTQTIEKSTSVLLNYGAVGALLVLCILAIIFLVRFFLKQNEKRDVVFNKQVDYLTAQLNDMRQKMDKYVEEDRREMMNVISQNTQAMRELKIEIHNKQ